MQYDKEFPGTNTQEVLRALIERTEYLDAVLECAESKDAAWHLRMALYKYEVRAFRRTVEKLNRMAGAHDDTERPKAWRDYPDGIPFNEQDIETLPTGPDGHVRIAQDVLEEYLQSYYGMDERRSEEFRGADQEPRVRTGIASVRDLPVRAGEA